MLVLDSHTYHAALVAIPRETGSPASFIDKVDRLEVLYHPDDTSSYSNAVKELLGKQPNFTIRFDSDSFEYFIDFLAGLDIYIPSAIDAVVDGKRFLFLEERSIWMVPRAVPTLNTAPGVNPLTNG